MASGAERPVQLPPPTPIERGRPDSPRHDDVERRHISADQRSRRWGRTTFRERRLGNRLDRELHLLGIVLHGRAVEVAEQRRTEHADHIAVAPNGVWVINAHPDIGRLSIVDDRDRHHVRVGDADRSAAATAVTLAASGVRQCLRHIGFGWVDVHPAVCFTSAEWGHFAKPCRIDGAWVAAPKALLDKVTGAGPIDPADINTIAQALSNDIRPLAE